MIIGKKDFDTDNNTYIMGILNVTPDSFYDGGMHNDEKSAVDFALSMINDGADIIDIGGVSTRPGFREITAEDEIKRTIPVLKTLRKNTSVPISIDTFNPEVAEAAAYEGADIINDIYGFKKYSKLASITAEYGINCILMHNRGNSNYKNITRDIISDLMDSISIANSFGVKDDKIILDPGIGFAKSVQDNLYVTKNIRILTELGYPVLYASSNKSFIEAVTGEKKDKRLYGTLATTAWAVMNHCSFVRVHNIKENKQLTQMLKAIEGGN